ncbi:MAG: hypothetical protein QXF17_04335 [Ignisphaera sp.]
MKEKQKDWENKDNNSSSSSGVGGSNNNNDNNSNSNKEHQRRHQPPSSTIPPPSSSPPSSSSPSSSSPPPSPPPTLTFEEQRKSRSINTSIAQTRFSVFTLQLLAQNLNELMHNAPEVSFEMGQLLQGDVAEAEKLLVYLQSLQSYHNRQYAIVQEIMKHIDILYRHFNTIEEFLISLS